ncbi:MAG: S8 family serine peptidase [Gammaproteobacteria bacterium]
MMRIAMPASCASLVLAACATTPSKNTPGADWREAVARQVLVTLVAPPRFQRVGPRARTYGRPGAYSMSRHVKRAAARLATSYGLTQVADWPIAPLGVHCVVFEVPPGRSTAQAIAALSGDADVEIAQPMNLFEVLSTSYDDPYLHLQHGVLAMQVEHAHQWTSGKGVDVAVVDTGIDTGHPELKDHIAHTRNFVSHQPDVFDTDVHGTAVAGVIASAANNGVGIVGVAPDVRILALKACWQTRRDGAYCSSFTLAQAISFAIERGADVINLSLGGPPDPILRRLIARAAEGGAIIVAAGGKHDDDNGDFPSSLSEVIAVHAAESEGGSRSRLSAPGVDILTTMPDGRFDFMSGSSLAAAHVSGVVALLLERDRELSPGGLVRLLTDTSQAAPERVSNAVQIVNACTAVAELIGAEECPVPLLAHERDSPPGAYLSN